MIIIKRSIKKIFVPNGIWFDYLNGKKYVGNKYYTNFYREEDYPVFVKAGSIVPNSVNIKEEIPSVLELNIYPLDNGEYSFYEDDGFSNNYKKGLYMITKFSYQYNKDDYNFTISREDGKNLLSKRTYLLRFKNTRNISEINLGDKNIKYTAYYDRDDFIVRLDNVTMGRNIDINIKGTNIFVGSDIIINEEIKNILFDLEIKTGLKEELDKILFSDLEVRKKRIKIRKLKRKGLDKKYINVFINLLEYIEKS